VPYDLETSGGKPARSAKERVLRTLRVLAKGGFAMYARRQVTGAIGLLLLGLVGCAVPDFLALNFNSSNGPQQDPVLNASLQTVSHTAQTVLKEMGIAAVVNEEGERIVLQGTTAKGARFFLKLTRLHSESGGEQTHATIDWEGSPDSEISIRLLAGLRVLSAGKS